MTDWFGAVFIAQPWLALVPGVFFLALSAVLPRRVSADGLTEGSLQRLTSATGEGAMTVAFIHRRCRVAAGSA